MIAYKLANDIDFIEEQSHSIHWDSSAGRSLFTPEKVGLSDTNPKTFTLTANKHQWPDFSDMGSGYVLVSDALREFFENELRSGTEAYQFLKPNVVQGAALQNYHLLHSLKRIEPFVGDEPKTISRWKFSKPKVANLDYAFRVGSASLCVAGELAKRIAERKFRGLYLRAIDVA